LSSLPVDDAPTNSFDVAVMVVSPSSTIIISIHKYIIMMIIHLRFGAMAMGAIKKPCIMHGRWSSSSSSSSSSRVVALICVCEATRSDSDRGE
jgi:hypothetical protein